MLFTGVDISFVMAVEAAGEEFIPAFPEFG